MTDALAVNLDAPCWLWQSHVGVTGYGQKRFRGTMWKAHRYMWTVMRGPIPKGMQIDHLCRIRHCVNPQHMEVVTQHENWLRGEACTVQNKRKTHCKYGHEFTPENTYYRTGKRGPHRVCIQCNRVTNGRTGEYRPRGQYGPRVR